MGLSAAAHAAQMERRTPATPAEPVKLERGHARGRTIVDRSRTDGAELRGIGMVGRGIRGCLPRHAPGDPVSYLERIAKEDAELNDKRARLKAARARFKQQKGTPTGSA